MIGPRISSLTSLHTADGGRARNGNIHERHGAHGHGQTDGAAGNDVQHMARHALADCTHRASAHCAVCSPSAWLLQIVR